jgi:hypothetical protein
MALYSSTFGVVIYPVVSSLARVTKETVLSAPILMASLIHVPQSETLTPSDTVSEQRSATPSRRSSAVRLKKPLLMPIWAWLRFTKARVVCRRS